MKIKFLLLNLVSISLYAQRTEIVLPRQSGYRGILGVIPNGSNPSTVGYINLGQGLTFTGPDANGHYTLNFIPVDLQGINQILGPFQNFDPSCAVPGRALLSDGHCLQFPDGYLVGTTATQDLTNKRINGIPSTDFPKFSGTTSNIQQQINNINASLPLKPELYRSTNAINLTQWVSAMTKATSRLVSVHIFGDSTNVIFGVGNGLPNVPNDRWPDMMKNYFASKGLLFGTGFIPLQISNGGAGAGLGNLGGIDSSVYSISPYSGAHTTTNYSIGGPIELNLGNAGVQNTSISPGTTITATSPIAYSGIRVGCSYNSTSNNLGMLVTIDGVAQATRACPAFGTSSTYNSGVYGYGIGAVNNHTLTITCSSGSTGDCSFYAVAFDKQGTGFEVTNFSIGGATLSELADGVHTNSQMVFSDIYAGGPDLSIIATGTNETAGLYAICPLGSTSSWCNGSFAALGGLDYTTMLSNLITRQKGRGGSVLVVGPPLLGLTPTLATASYVYQNAAYQIAKAYGAAYVDYGSAGTPYTVPLANGLLASDTIHPTIAGHLLHFRDIYQTLFLDTLPQAPITSGVGTGTVTGLSGDVTSTGSGVVPTVVTKLQGYPISPSMPVTGRVLTFDGTQWIATIPTGGGASTAGPFTFTNASSLTITSTQHGFSNANIVPFCYDTSVTPNHQFFPDVTIDPSTYQIVATFGSNKTGKCIVK